MARFREARPPATSTDDRTLFAWAAFHKWHDPRVRYLRPLPGWTSDSLRKLAIDDPDALLEVLADVIDLDTVQVSSWHRDSRARWGRS
jgi:hypothetical protein